MLDDPSSPGLPLGFEPCDYLPRVHPELDDLQATRRLTGSSCSARKNQHRTTFAQFL